MVDPRDPRTQAAQGRWARSASAAPRCSPATSICPTRPQPRCHDRLDEAPATWAWWTTMATSAWWGAASDMIISGGPERVPPRGRGGAAPGIRPWPRPPWWGCPTTTSASAWSATVVGYRTADTGPGSLITWCPRPPGALQVPQGSSPGPRDLPRNAMGKIQKNRAAATRWTAETSCPYLTPSPWEPAIHAGLETAIVRARAGRRTARPRRTTAHWPPFDFDNTCIAGDIGEAVLQRHRHRMLGRDLVAGLHAEACRVHGRQGARLRSLRHPLWRAHRRADLEALTDRVLERGAPRRVASPTVAGMVDLIDSPAGRTAGRCGS